MRKVFPESGLDAEASESTRGEWEGDAVPEAARVRESGVRMEAVHGETKAALAEALGAPEVDAGNLVPARGSREAAPAATDAGLVLELNWHRLLVMGHGSTMELRMTNQGGEVCGPICVDLRSRALAEAVQWSHRELRPGQCVEALLELDALRSGVSILQVSVSCGTPGGTVPWTGRTPMTVHVAPSESNITVSVGNIFSELQDGAATGAELNIETLVDIGKIKTVNDLISLVLPDRFVRVPLERELAQPVSVPDGQGVSAATRRKIPTRYVSYVRRAARMELVPVCGSRMEGEEEPSILIVAGDTFRLGRQRGAVDYLAWFWPRTPQNDERTMRLSKGSHLILRRMGGAVFLEDPHSVNGSTFRGLRVPRPCETGEDLAGLPSSIAGGRMPLDGSGVAVLGGEYELALVPMARTVGPELGIVNEATWPGVTSVPQEPCSFGCVRLDPRNSSVGPQRSVWILSDVPFGKGDSNGLVFADERIPDTEGRFLYYRSQFWLESLSQKSSVHVDANALHPGELVPLVEGQTLRIGGREYRLHFPEEPAMH